MMDRFSEKLCFTVQEASDLGVGSVRKIRYMIKDGRIECSPPRGDGTKRAKRFIPRSELVRLGILPPAPEVSAKPRAAQILELRRLERHLGEIQRLRNGLRSELWLPPLSYVPTDDPSAQSDAYFRHTVHWTDAEDGSLTIRLPVESESSFKYLQQHTEDSELWQHLPEWKRLGGLYVRSRAVLLGSIWDDIQTDTNLPIAASDATRGVLRGFSRVIFRSLFPRVRPDESKRKQLATEAITLGKERRWKEATSVNRHIIGMFPTDISALRRLGKALVELQRHVSAKEAYSRALEIDPQDAIAQKNLGKLLQKHEDDTGTERVDGGRYRVGSRGPDLWVLAVFADDEGENIASVYPTEIDSVIAAFQDLLRKYRSPSKTEIILVLRRSIDQLERSLLQELKAATLGTLARVECDGCRV